VRCATGRWRGDAKAFTVRWRRIGSSRVIGRGPTHRVGRRDAATGLACAVTATGPGGRLTATARRRR
jgi:hypothetical protein